MTSRKRRRSTVEEYIYESSDDEGCKTPPPLHRHTHIESQNGRLRTQQLLYSMPSSPHLSTADPQQSVIMGPIDNAEDGMLSAISFDDIQSDTEVADQVTGNDSDKHRVRGVD